MDTLERFSRAGIVPVVVIDHAADALPTARALLDGGVDVMEITFRTEAAPEAIRAVAEGCPEMLVGAGTVVTLDVRPWRPGRSLSWPPDMTRRSSPGAWTRASPSCPDASRLRRSWPP